MRLPRINKLGLAMTELFNFAGSTMEINGEEVIT